MLGASNVECIRICCLSPNKSVNDWLIGISTDVHETRTVSCNVCDSYFLLKKKRIIYNTHEIWMSTTQQKNIQTHPKSTFSWRFNVFVSVDDCQNDTLLKNHRFMSIHWLFTNNINSILSFCLFPLYITKKKRLNQLNPRRPQLCGFILISGHFCFSLRMFKFQINHLH